MISGARYSKAKISVWEGRKRVSVQFCGVSCRRRVPFEVPIAKEGGWGVGEGVEVQIVRSRGWRRVWTPIIHKLIERGALLIDGDSWGVGLEEVEGGIDVPTSSQVPSN